MAGLPQEDQPVLQLALLHLVLGVATDDQDHALPADDLAPLTAGLD
jgi:hypothetical protein